MVGTFLALLGLSILASTTFLDDSTLPEEETDNPVDRELGGDEDLLGGYLTPDGSIELSDPIITEVGSDVTHDVCLPDGVADVILDGETSLSIISIPTGYGDIENEISPLIDWTTDTRIEIVDADQDDIIHLNLTADIAGHFIVMQADYIESSGNVPADTERVYLGANVYFVPEGATFPENYVWSEDGASLYEMSATEGSHDTFAGMSFISRIDAGSIALPFGPLDGADSFDALRSQMMPRFCSNAPLSFIGPSFVNS